MLHAQMIMPTRENASSGPEVMVGKHLMAVSSRQHIPAETAALQKNEEFLEQWSAFSATKCIEGSSCAVHAGRRAKNSASTSGELAWTQLARS